MKNLLGINHLTKNQILHILNRAKFLKNGDINQISDILKGKTVATIFYENSTRTRLSFELAAKRLGAVHIDVPLVSSSESKGESWMDTIKTIDIMGSDVIVVRHGLSGAAELITRQGVKSAVINAGDGINEHPTQALLDMFTILEHKKEISELKVLIVGDVLHSRVARSNIYLFNKFGVAVRIIAPKELMYETTNDFDVQIFDDLDEAICDVDVIISLRLQLERQVRNLVPSLDEYVHFYGINEERMRLAKHDVIVMHPGPMNRGLEITSSVADGPRSVISEQITNGIAVRMAVLEALCGKTAGM